MTVSKPIEQRYRALGYAGPVEVAGHASYDALLEAIHTYFHTLNSGSGDSRRH